jgi:hypothetical protein
VSGHDHHQGDVAGPADPAEPAGSLLDVAQARAMAAGLREAMGDVRRSVAVLAARVRDAHAARVWLPLGFASWQAYCAAEFGISRAQAYRLLDIARAVGAINAAVTTVDPSRMRDTDTAIDFGLSQRALLAVAGRADDVATLITRRLAALTASGARGPE